MVRLKRYLLLNSAFSALSGLALLYLNTELRQLFGFENRVVLPAIGINLLIFSLIVYYVANKQLTNKSLVTLISSLDMLWVVGTAILVVFQLFNLTTAAYIIISVVALWIGFLGMMQIMHNKGTE